MRLCVSIPSDFSSDPDWPEAESEVVQEEAQHVGAAGQIVKVYVYRPWSAGPSQRMHGAAFPFDNCATAHWASSALYCTGVSGGIQGLAWEIGSQVGDPAF